MFGLGRACVSYDIVSRIITGLTTIRRLRHIIAHLSYTAALRHIIQKHYVFETSCISVLYYTACARHSMHPRLGLTFLRFFFPGPVPTRSRGTPHKCRTMSDASSADTQYQFSCQHVRAAFAGAAGSTGFATSLSTSSLNRACRSSSIIDQMYMVMFVLNPFPCTISCYSFDELATSSNEVNKVDMQHPEKKSFGKYFSR